MSAASLGAAPGCFPPCGRSRKPQAEMTFPGFGALTPSGKVIFLLTPAARRKAVPKDSPTSHSGCQQSQK